MTTKQLALTLCLLATTTAHGGHGLMNSFADIEWLPDPGVTPDQIGYRLDRLAENAALQFAQSPDEEISRCLEFALEKLAETSAMIKTQNPLAASIAMRHYGGYIARVAAIIERAEPPITAHRHRFINALLEHLYIMSVDYLDMPLGIRTSLSPLFANTLQHFEAQSARLSKGEKAALFFKEEEIRWSLEMTHQADEQKITNWDGSALAVGTD